MKLFTFYLAIVFCFLYLILDNISSDLKDYVAYIALISLLLTPSINIFIWAKNFYKEGKKQESLFAFICLVALVIGAVINMNR